MFFLLFHLFCFTALAQSVETGFVKEYNGEKAKTPLAGVELSVNGAPSTISGNDGRYTLKFSVLKPGQTIKYNEIYKSGYVIFNKDALDYWRISNSQKTFVIVMCKESAFRELKKKFYGIIEKSYKDEYLKQEVIAKNTASDAANLETRIKQLQKEYNEKLSNINTYVELFARIDRNEMDSTVARALILIEKGKIDEGIKVYEELRLVQQVEYQLDKWNSGENMRQAAETMISDSQRDLVVLSEKLQQQMGLYEMGGADYNEKRDKTISNLIKVYYKLNSVFNGKYNEELGRCICKLADNTKSWTERMADYHEAANLPSWHGWVNLGDHYNILAYNNSQLVDSARICYQKAMELEMSDSLRIQVNTALLLIADFFAIQNNGDTLYYKKIGETDSVYVSPRTTRCYNRVSGTMEIPETVIYQGKRYHVVGITPRAFFKNRHLKKVILPNNIYFIGMNAFDKCDSLEQIVLGSNVRRIWSDAIPMTTEIILPVNFTEDEWIDEFIRKRFDIIAEKADKRYYQPLKKLLLDLSQNKVFNKNKRAYFIGVLGYLDIQYGDTISALKYLLEANKQMEHAFDLDIGSIYYRQKDYANSYEYFVKCADTNNSVAYNALAYMYARGEYVKQDYQKAMELVDKAIALSPEEADYIDTKGEIYLMMGQRDSALVYWNKVLEMNPQFDTNRSDLYKQLFPQEEKLDSMDFKRKQRLKDYLNIVLLVGKAEYEQQYEAFGEIEYEEMVSIGIIALQVLIRTKTEEQLNKYNAAYIGAAVRWAINNECHIRYDWFRPIYPSSWIYDKSQYTNEERQGVDVTRFQVKLGIYQTVLMMYKHLKIKMECENTDSFDTVQINDLPSLTKSEKEILDRANVMIMTIKAMSGSKKEIIMDLLNGVKWNKIREKYHTTLWECDNIMNDLKEALNKNNLQGY